MPRVHKNVINRNCVQAAQDQSKRADPEALGSILIGSSRYWGLTVLPARPPDPHDPGQAFHFGVSRPLTAADEALLRETAQAYRDAQLHKQRRHAPPQAQNRRPQRVAKAPTPPPAPPPGQFGGGFVQRFGAQGLRNAMSAGAAAVASVLHGAAPPLQAPSPSAELPPEHNGAGAGVQRGTTPATGTEASANHPGGVHAAPAAMQQPSEHRDVSHAATASVSAREATAACAPSTEEPPPTQRQDATGGPHARTAESPTSATCGGVSPTQVAGGLSPAPTLRASLSPVRTQLQQGVGCGLEQPDAACSPESATQRVTTPVVAGAQQVDDADADAPASPMAEGFATPDAARVSPGATGAATVAGGDAMPCLTQQAETHVSAQNEAAAAHTTAAPLLTNGEDADAAVARHTSPRENAARLRSPSALAGDSAHPPSQQLASTSTEHGSQQFFEHAQNPRALCASGNGAPSPVASPLLQQLQTPVAAVHAPISPERAARQLASPVARPTDCDVALAPVPGSKEAQDGCNAGSNSPADKEASDPAAIAAGAGDGDDQVPPGEDAGAAIPDTRSPEAPAACCPAMDEPGTQPDAPVQEPRAAPSPACVAVEGAARDEDGGAVAGPAPPAAITAAAQEPSEHQAARPQVIGFAAELSTVPADCVLPAPPQQRGGGAGPPEAVQWSRPQSARSVRPADAAAQLGLQDGGVVRRCGSAPNAPLRRNSIKAAGAKRHREQAGDAARAAAVDEALDAGRAQDSAGEQVPVIAAATVTHDVPDRLAQSDGTTAAPGRAGALAGSGRPVAGVHDGSKNVVSVVGGPSAPAHAPSGRCWSEGSGVAAAAGTPGRFSWRIGGLATFRAEKRFRV